MFNNLYKSRKRERERKIDECKQQQCVKDINFYLSLFCLAGPAVSFCLCLCFSSSSLQLLRETLVALFMLVPHLTLIQVYSFTHTITRVRLHINIIILTEKKTICIFIWMQQAAYAQLQRQRQPQRRRRRRRAYLIDDASAHNERSCCCSVYRFVSLNFCWLDSLVIYLFMFFLHTHTHTASSFAAPVTTNEWFISMPHEQHLAAFYHQHQQQRRAATAEQVAAPALSLPFTF